jgi:two-component system response regulator RegX3
LLAATRILVADDDQGILDAVTDAFERERFDVVAVSDGEHALETARAEAFDVVLLNVVMPKLFGTDVCRTLRAESDVPIVLISARDRDIDRVLGLELGADDYVSKPFSLAVLVSRVRALLRRRALDLSAAQPAVSNVGDLRLDFARHQAYVGEEPVHLTRSEFRLLSLLAQEPERVFTRRELMEHLWQSTYVGDERAADIHVSNLRAKIEQDPRNPARLLTVRGVGYTLVASVSVRTQKL